jgi:predicted PurR-regulated permease PerM
LTRQSRRDPTGSRINFSIETMQRDEATSSANRRAQRGGSPALRSVLRVILMKRQTESAADRHLWEITPLLELVLLLILFFVAWLVYFLGNVFLPLLLALILAEVTNPGITYLEQHRGWPRPVTIALLLSVIVIGLLSFFTWLGPLLFDQLTQLIAAIPGYLSTLGATYNVELGDIVEQAKQWLKNLGSQPEQTLGKVFGTTGRALGVLTAALTTLTSFFVWLLLMIVAFFFFAWHFNETLEKLQNYLPKSRRQRIGQIAAMMDKAVGDFFRGRIIISVIVGVLLSTGWYFTGVPFWFLLGMLTGFLNIFPYLSVVTWPVAIVLKYADALGTGQSADLLSVVVWPSAVYIVVQLLESWILTPWIQSGETNLGPGTVLIVVFVGGALAGVWGLLFAIPVAACLKILLQELALPPLKRWAESR